MSEDKRNAIGFVGLGNIGLPLSCNLLAAGFRVLGFSRRNHAAFTSAGGELVAHVADLAALPVIVLCLPNAQALRETVDGLLSQCSSGIHPGQLVINLSSQALADKQAQAKRLAQKGCTLLDCEISGLPFQAAEKKAVIFQSGDAAAIQRLEPVFRAMADQCFYLGDFGAATNMKLIANTMVCVHNLMTAEAINLGARVGLSAELMLKVLGPSAASSTTFMNKAPLMQARNFEAGKGPFRHMFGHLERAAALGLAASASTPLLDAAHRIYTQAQAQGMHDLDIAAVIQIIEAPSRTEPHEH
jgi:3-hydroxyisobutyrate dehydrogenase-like beta-hydroxyacid dehydrogenase